MGRHDLHESSRGIGRHASKGSAAARREVVRDRRAAHYLLREDTSPPEQAGGASPTYPGEPDDETECEIYASVLYLAASAHRDAACPISTGGGTRRVRSVRGRGGGDLAASAPAVELVHDSAVRHELLTPAPIQRLTTLPTCSALPGGRRCGGAHSGGAAPHLDNASLPQRSRERGLRRAGEVAFRHSKEFVRRRAPVVERGLDDSRPGAVPGAPARAAGAGRRAAGTRRARPTAAGGRGDLGGDGDVDHPLGTGVVHSNVQRERFCRADAALSAGALARSAASQRGCTVRDPGEPTRECTRKRKSPCQQLLHLQRVD
jgi:hypothetical protein